MIARWVRITGTVALLVLLVGGAVAPGTGARDSPGAAPLRTTGPAPTAFHLPPALRLPGPASSEYWYTQVGATLAEENGSSVYGSLTTLVEDVKLVASSYPIGYELNGLSSTGDWYQVLVAENWGGCNSGYEMVYEIWDNSGGSEAPVCDPNVTLNGGDMVKLSLSFSSSKIACLDLEDLTTTSQEHDCETEPDTGATGFQLLGAVSNSNGYFTGPMTEIANPAPTSCPDYKNMPIVDYTWPFAFHVTGYYPFSDEFEVVGSSIVSECYSSDDAQATLSAGDPVSDITDTAAGTTYGPHYVAGQNFSYLDAADGWRLVTDPVPLADVTVAPTSGTFTLGTVLELNATVTGGTSPYTALWSVNGSFVSPLGIHYNWTASSAGTYDIDAYGVDAQELVNGPATSVIAVPGVLSAGPIATDTPADGADVGQWITISSRVVGGLPPYQFEWGGLPDGCVPADQASLGCVPTAPGTFPVTLEVTDSNNTVVQAPGLSLVVSPALSADISSSRASADVNQTIWVNVTQTGGAAPVRYLWEAVPAGCPVPTGDTAVCVPSEPGEASFEVTLVDGNGITLNLTEGPFPISGDPTVGLSASRSTADAGVLVVLSSQVLEGDAPYRYDWSGLPSGCSPTSGGSSATCGFSAGTPTVWLNITDANGFAADAAPVHLGIYPALTATITGGGNLTQGQTLDLTVTPSGGSGSVAYAWQNLPSGCSPPTGGDLSCVPSTTGEYNITVLLSDGGGGRVTLVATVNVTAVPSGSSAGSDSTLLIVAGIAVVLVVVLVVVVAVRRRRG